MDSGLINSVNLISSFLSDRQQSVHANASASSMQAVRYGVPLWAVLGPLLFSIYINDLPFHIKNLCERFADDTTIHFSDTTLDRLSESLQEGLNQLSEWTELNHMSLNPQKTKCMIITTRHKRQNITSTFNGLIVNDKIVKQVDHHKVLAVTIDNNLS